ncbi:hypothetical protein E2C01_002277 [Portunus trituberculatus]|uniref:Uncharacterized protein n=1 Tax=Portunus trituberculatus TaxID=210409 RepID=A0A5B7CLJ0_PORTR|nr:hypothetical protein [Portunus trituberculatus]
MCPAPRGRQAQGPRRSILNAVREKWRCTLWTRARRNRGLECEASEEANPCGSVIRCGLRGGVWLTGGRPARVTRVET